MTSEKKTETEALNVIYNEDKNTKETSDDTLLNFELQSQILSTIMLNKKKIKEILRFYYLLYCLSVALSIILGLIFKIISPNPYDLIKKNNFITGIPVLREYFIFVSFILSLIYFIFSISLFYCNKNIKNTFSNLYDYEIDINSCFIFSNTFLYVTLVLVHSFVYGPIDARTGFRLSGHTAAVLLSGIILIHIHFCYQLFMKLKIMRIFNFLYRLVVIFLICHNIYLLFWTTYVFHSGREVIFSYLINIIFILIVKMVKIDYYCLVFVKKCVRR